MSLESLIYDYSPYAPRPTTTAPYLVFNGTKGGAPTYTHSSRALAEIEAKRLANANPGQEFYVLGSVSVTKAPKLQASTRALV